jgi:hypothetical protein
MTLVFRTDNLGEWGYGKGSNLTAPEVDNNFWYLFSLLTAIQDHNASGADIDYFSESVDGTQFFVHLTDHRVLGPYALPQSQWHFKGVWAAGTPYLINDTFFINGTAYLVLIAHTSAGTFDPNATDGLGHNLYGVLVSSPSNVLPVGGTTGQRLAKSSDTDYITVWADDTLAGLADVGLGSPHDVNDVLTWNGSLWTNAPAVSAISQLSDVVLSSPSVNQVLVWNGSDWVNSTPAGRFGTSTALGNSGTVSIDPTLGDLFTTSPTADVLINANSAPVGAHVVVEITTVNASGFAVRFGNPILYRGDIILPKESGVTLTISFIGDGSYLTEVSRSNNNREINNHTIGSANPCTLDTKYADVFTCTPTGDFTINAAYAEMGQRVSIVFTTSGASSHTITFGTGFKTTGTLATGTASGKVFTVNFVGDGTNLNEVSRTTAM